MDNKVIVRFGYFRQYHIMPNALSLTHPAHSCSVPARYQTKSINIFIRGNEILDSDFKLGILLKFTWYDKLKAYFSIYFLNRMNNFSVKSETSHWRSEAAHFFPVAVTYAYIPISMQLPIKAKWFWIFCDKVSPPSFAYCESLIRVLRNCA